MDFIKKNFKLVFAFLLGIVVSGTIVYASGILASTVTYDNSTSGLKDSNGDDVTDAQTAIDVLYERTRPGNIIVANWLNENYTVSTSWQTMNPTLYNNNYFDVVNGSLKVKKAGNYKIYYQSAADSCNATANIRLLINGTQVGTCGSTHARCDNREIAYTADLGVDDQITIQAYTTNAACGARVVVSVVKNDDAS